MKLLFLFSFAFANDFNFARPRLDLDNALGECARKNETCSYRDLENEIKLDSR